MGTLESHIWLKIVTAARISPRGIFSLATCLNMSNYRICLFAYSMWILNVVFHYHDVPFLELLKRTLPNKISVEIIILDWVKCFPLIKVERQNVSILINSRDNSLRTFNNLFQNKYYLLSFFLIILLLFSYSFPHFYFIWLE